MATDLNTIRQAVKFFAQGDSAVTAVYLHGSAATGRMDKESDIDIAILARESLAPDERRTLRMHAMYELAKVLGRIAEDLDVVILQDVPVLLRYNVIRKGMCLYERDRAIRKDFELSVERAYDDEEPHLRRETEMILERILSKAVS